MGKRAVEREKGCNETRYGVEATAQRKAFHVRIRGGTPAVEMLELGLKGCIGG